MSEKIDFPDYSCQRKEVRIHPLADVSSRAELDSGVVIGPGVVVGPDVSIGANSVIGANVVLEGRLQIGAENKIFPGACLGLEPQDLKYDGAHTEVIIGNKNTLRECVTINRATEEGAQTKIGDGNLLMAYCHIAHNCLIGDRVIMSNSVQVAGHVIIEDKAVIGGCTGIHQFVQIGSLSMIGGMSKIERDVPPFCLVEGNPARVRGLNIVGLKRSGFELEKKDEFKQLQEIWKLLYRSGNSLKHGLEKARQENLFSLADQLCIFLEQSSQKNRRGPIPVIKKLTK